MSRVQSYSHNFTSLSASADHLRTQHLCLLRGELAALLDCLIDVTDHVEGRLWEVVVLAIEDLLDGADGVLERHETALQGKKCKGSVNR